MRNSIENHKDEFDKQFKKTFMAMAVMWVIGVGVMLGIIGFVIWMIVKLMQHFGVIG